MSASGRKRLLFVTPYLPRPRAHHAGGVESAGILGWLLERYDVDLVCLGGVRDLKEARAIWPGVGTLECIPYRNSLTEKLTGVIDDVPHPRLWGRGARYRFRDAVRRRLAASSYDVIQLEHQETDLWIDTPGTMTRIIDLHDVVSGLLEHGTESNPAPDVLTEVAAARRHEADLLSRYHAVMVRSGADRKRLAALGDDRRIGILRHFTDASGEPGSRSSRIPGRILLTGSFTRRVNQNAARELIRDILPHILAVCPEATVRIVGAGADTTLRDLARPGRVEIQGAVPDLGPAYEESMVLVNPLRCGGGVITRHVEAMAHGLPVVTVPAGAEGLDVSAGFDVAEDPAELAGLAVRLLNDAARWDVLSRSGSAAVRTRYNPEKVRSELFAVHDRFSARERHD